jgi:hypothetical protein
MAAEGNANSVMDITYDNLPELMSATGIFSFCIYIDAGKFNANVSSTAQLYSYPHKPPHIYLIGLLSYAQMIHENPIWRGWKVVIHTDKATVDGNPLAFKALKDRGVILGMTILKGRYSDMSKFRGIFRNNRYYPLFIEGLNIPILIRDADTIFEQSLSSEATNKLYEIQQKNSSAVLSIKNDNDLILPTFIENLSKWEYMYYTKISKFINKVIFSYDDSYSLDLTNENYDKNNLIKNSLVWTGRPENRPKRKREPSRYRYSNHLKVKARFLAGNLSKVGYSLPIELWNIGLPRFLHKYLTNANIAKTGFDLIKKITISDEVFLTEVIYKWCRENDYTEFFKLNYVSPNRLSGLFEKYMEIKYPLSEDPTRYNVTQLEYANRDPITNNNNNNGWGPSTPPAGTTLLPKKMLRRTIKKIKRNRINNKNHLLYNYINPTGLSRNNPYTSRVYSNKLSLEYPEVMMNNEYFFNPLKNDLERRPESLPVYFFGGTKKKRVNKRKTYKNRK